MHNYSFDTPRKIVSSLKQGHNKPVTIPELSGRIRSSKLTTRRRVNEMVNNHKMEHAGVRVCNVTGKELYTYKLV